MKTKRLDYYLDWTDFTLGFTIAKPNICTGYKLYIGIDLGFLSIWVYFWLLKDC